MHRVGVIGRPLREVVILEVSLGDRDMEFAGASHALTVRRDNDGGIEAALVGSPRALKEGDLDMYIAVPGEFARERDTRAALYVLSGGIRRAFGARIRGVATQG